jgi:hypothetical protein
VKHYYLSKYNWVVNEGISCWESPYRNQSVGSVDLRPVSAQGKSGGVPSGYCVLVFDSKNNDPELNYIGDERTIVTGSKLAKVKQLLNIPVLSPNIPDDLIWKILTTDNDETKVCPNLMPKRNMDMELRMGGRLLKSKKLNPGASLEWGVVLDRLQKNYVSMRKSFDRNPVNPLHRKSLTVWREKYGIDNTDIFIPVGEKKQTPLPHNTTITESFDTTDSSTLGPDLSWTELTGDFKVNGNAATVADDSVNSFARADTDLSSDDQSSQIDITALPVSASANWFGAAARVSDSATTLYYTIGLNSSGSADLIRVAKVVEGSLTNLDGDLSFTRDLPDTIILEIDGSSFKTSIGGVDKHDFTDTAITGNLRTGMIGRINTAQSEGDVKGDNFEASDLGVVVSGGELTLNSKYW